MTTVKMRRRSTDLCHFESAAKCYRQQGVLIFHDASPLRFRSSNRLGTKNVPQQSGERSALFLGGEFLGMLAAMSDWNQL
jgi:hypothetical protein